MVSSDEHHNIAVTLCARKKPDEIITRLRGKASPIGRRGQLLGGSQQPCFATAEKRGSGSGASTLFLSFRVGGDGQIDGFDPIRYGATLAEMAVL